MTALGYTRLSQDSDTSIDRQKRHIKEYAVENGLDLEEPIYDDGEQASGWDSERSEYQKLRERITGDDAVDALILNDKRRIARDIDEVMRLVPDLRQHGVELHTYQDGQLDLSDAMRAAIEILQAAAAHKEKLEEIEKSIEAVQERIEDGYDHGPPRFGMEYGPNGKYQQPNDEFETVEEVWALRDEGLSYSDIEDKTGVPSSTAQRIVENREWYLKRAGEEHG
jgi:DNA invertase Pin-like site-specific DNA recombinase